MRCRPAQHDFEAFYRKEIELRRKIGYPPFSRLLQITLSHANSKTLLNSAVKLVTLLKKKKKNTMTILGPAPAPLQKQRNRYRMLVLIKGQSSSDMHELVRDVLRDYDDKSIRIIVDVDPTFML